MCWLDQLPWMNVHQTVGIAPITYVLVATTGIEAKQNADRCDAAISSVSKAQRHQHCNQHTGGQPDQPTPAQSVLQQIAVRGFAACGETQYHHHERPCMECEFAFRCDLEREPNGDQHTEEPLRAERHGPKPEFTGTVRWCAAIRGDEQVGRSKSFQPDGHRLAQRHQPHPADQHQHRHRPREPADRGIIEARKRAQHAWFYYLSSSIITQVVTGICNGLVTTRHATFAAIPRGPHRASAHPSTCTHRLLSAASSQLPWWTGCVGPRQ